ncbi:MAG TPA: aminotransferase class III-fold pyridoxal phosphate-dependent enzyme [Solirubrobacteraceae bacterium]|jgi:ornithine--oxo-acid transaminase|nr:aminotransferase class III-fold pyridoxal phosphate-dependent enzyme [Solirubrobacteraceae bacterium]
MTTATRPMPGISDSLGILDEALARADETNALAARYLDPSLVDMLHVIGFDRRFVHARGSWLYDSEGREYLDFHTGEGFASLGHAHPDVREALEAVLAADLTDGVQIHYSVLAGMLAQELTGLLPDALDAAFFGSSGAEVVDSVMKFARAATGRPRLLSCDGAFHGVTIGPLSLVGDDFFKEGFEPLLPGCARVPFGDLDALEAELRKGDVAAFITEPIQGNLVRMPPAGYLRAAQDLCRRYGTLFALDEVQTGLGRTGTMFALDRFGVEPDFVTIGKALSGGYMPVSAMVTRREIFQRAVGTLERCFVHQSTYGRNRLSMTAALASLRVIEREELVANAERMGQVLMGGLRELQSRYEMIADVRGSGLMVGIELGQPSSRAARLNWRLFHMASGGLFPQLIVIPLHRDHQVITMAGGKNDVIKLLPPLTITEEEVELFLERFESVLADVHRSGSHSWGIVRDIASATLTRRSRGGVQDSLPAIMPPRGHRIDPSADNACLVTGATGFIGGHVTQRLLAEGHQVRCLVRPSSDTTLLETMPVEIAVGDLTDAASLSRAAAGCRYVVHCAAQVSDWATTEQMTQVNVAGTRNLLRAATEASAERFVHISTTDVYGYPERKVDETHVAAAFCNWYSQTKRDAELEVRRVQEAGAIETVILRPATVYGPRSTDVVGEMAKAIRGRYMLLVDGGRAVAGLVYVDNLVDAALLALRHDSAPAQAFNVTDGLDVTWRQFADGLAAGLGAPPVRLSLPYRPAHGLGRTLESGYRALRRATSLDVPPLLSRQAVQILGRNQSFCNRKAREMLGWAPRIGYADGLEQTVRWLRAEHLAT